MESNQDEINKEKLLKMKKSLYTSQRTYYLKNAAKVHQYQVNYYHHQDPEKKAKRLAQMKVYREKKKAEKLLLVSVL
jgi:hypothetical protein